ncbi:sodium:proton antiporter, partial [Pseudomonas nitroreducens]
MAPRLKQREGGSSGLPSPSAMEEQPWPPLRDHVILVGFGRVGHLIAAALTEKQQPFLVIEDQPEVVKALRADGIPALYGNAAAPGMLEAAQAADARWLLIAIP